MMPARLATWLMARVVAAETQPVRTSTLSLETSCSACLAASPGSFLSSRGTQTSGRPRSVLISSTAIAPPRSWSEPSGAFGPLMPAEKPILIGSPLPAAGATAGAAAGAAGEAAGVGWQADSRILAVATSEAKGSGESRRRALIDGQLLSADGGRLVPEVNPEYR